MLTYQNEKAVLNHLGINTTKKVTIEYSRKYTMEYTGTEKQIQTVMKDLRNSGATKVNIR